jgi:uncharacterized membrane-anchored protein
MTAVIDVLRAHRTLGLAVAAMLQIGVLGSMLIDRLTHLRSGREIVVPIVPVDPRDLFRGDYVRLAFTISQAKLSEARENVQWNETVNVRLVPDRAAGWTVTEISTQPITAKGDEVILAARQMSQHRDKDQMWVSQLRYGIERYYVPEGKGLGLEKLARESKVAAILAIDAKGKAAIKGLMIDGDKVYDEPLL